MTFAWPPGRDDQLRPGRRQATTLKPRRFPAPRQRRPVFNPRRPRGPLLREMLRRSIDWQHRLLCGELVELRKRDLIGRIA